MAANKMIGKQKRSLIQRGKDCQHAQNNYYNLHPN